MMTELHHPSSYQTCGMDFRALKRKTLKFNHSEYTNTHIIIIIAIHIPHLTLLTLPQFGGTRTKNTDKSHTVKVKTIIMDYQKTHWEVAKKNGVLTVSDQTKYLDITVPCS